MQNLILAFPNRCDGASYSGGNWREGKGPANLADRDLSLLARSTDTSLAATQWLTRMDKGRQVRVVAVLGHNLTLDARYRIRISDAVDFSNLLYDSGWADVWPVLYAWDALEWQDDNWWSGRPSEEDIGKYPRHLIHILPQPVTGQYVWVEIDDGINPVGYIEAARMVIAGQWQPKWNMSWGHSVGVKSLTQMEELPAGARYYDIQGNRRSFAFALDWLDKSEAYGRALELMREADIHGEILLIPDPDDTLNLYRAAFYATLAKLDAIRRPNFAQYQHAYELEEIL